jgi:hypothetical protein
VRKRPVLGLSTDGMSVDELLAVWRAYQDRVDEVDETIRAMVDRWHKETDPVRKEKLEAELCGTRPDYEVLSAWTDLFYVAWVFTTFGCESKFVPDETQFTTMTDTTA